MKVLILSPYLKKPGGVAVYFSAVKDHFDFEYEFFFRGNKTTTKSPKVIFQYLIDYLRFAFLLLIKKHNVYLVNTSFAVTGCSRDQVYLQILKFLNKKVVVFFHGWNKAYEEKTDENQLEEKYPLMAFKKADAIIVLADEFKQKLISWGFNQKIYLETTVVDSKLTDDIEKGHLSKEEMISPFVFLFMARIEKEKGIFEAVDLFAEIQKELPDKEMVFKIAGSGSALDDLISYVKNREIQHVEFLGFISGESKKITFQTSHVLLFPTKHGEGMPICLLEAMAFGLPVLTTTVGGIKDFFEDGKMGLLVKADQLLTLDSIQKIKKLITSNESLNEISQYNLNYAKERFYATEVSKRLKNILVNTKNSKL